MIIYYLYIKQIVPQIIIINIKLVNLIIILNFILFVLYGSLQHKNINYNILCYAFGIYYIVMISENYINNYNLELSNQHHRIYNLNDDDYDNV